MFYRLLVRFLFLFDPEEVHYLTLNLFRVIRKIPLLGWCLGKIMGIRKPEKPTVFAGLTFKNPVGLAAGFDKDARYMHEFAAMGFGFIEVGTVTPLPQPGNDKPRLFRLIQDKAIINRMGFNNEGVEAMAIRLQHKPEGVLIGGNIGKNKITPNENAISDYEICFTRLYNLVDYFVVNVSSPNTPGLRALQEKEPLTRILSHLMQLRNRFVSEGLQHRPLFLKIAPDLTHSQLDDVIDIVLSTGIDGLVATNTTIDRSGLTTRSEKIEQTGAGGLSGKPLTKRSTEVIAYIHSKSGGKIPIIGVGGIHTSSDAIEKMQAGAGLVQLYTGFIYEGPALIHRICAALK
ncbi:MAG: quinone-dependent dihydroorotate dehydrogenase [Bacteroidia bacterium]|nr:quinone-dependent dihydroorotate dehydrogenase [Bacteroidia bacterium]